MSTNRQQTLDAFLSSPTPVVAAVASPNQDIERRPLRAPRRRARQAQQTIDDIVVQIVKAEEASRALRGIEIRRRFSNRERVDRLQFSQQALNSLTRDVRPQRIPQIERWNTVTTTAFRGRWTQVTVTVPRDRQDFSYWQREVFNRATGMYESPETDKQTAKKIIDRASLYIKPTPQARVRNNSIKGYWTVWFLVRDLQDEDPEADLKRVPISSSNAKVYNSIRDIMIDRLLIIEKMSEAGGDYKRIEGIEKVQFSISNYTQTRGSSYVELPPAIANKKAVINIKNEDDQCFKWAVLSSMHEYKNANQVSHYKKHDKELDFTGIEFPVSVDDIPKFERKNNIAISAYELQDDDVSSMRPWRVAPVSDKPLVNLMLYKGHWMWIKNWDRLWSDEKHCVKKCPRCLCSFSKDKNMEEHMRLCNGFEPRKTVMPDEGSTLSFKSAKLAQVRHPVALYADFEALQAPTGDSKKVARHEAMSFRIHIALPEGAPAIQQDYEYTGEKADVKFWETLFDIQKELDEHIFSCKKPVEMSKQDNKDFYSAKYCYLCGKGWNEPLEEKGTKPSAKVRDHCHITGAFRGAAHSCCNLKIKQNWQARNIPVFFHNSTGYDMHFLVSSLSEVHKECKKLDCIPINAQKFKTLAVDRFKILDSCAFLASSLDKLLENLPNEKKTRLRGICDTDEQFELVNRKLVLPYEKITSLEWLEQDISYDRNDYFSSLSLSMPAQEAMDHLYKVAKAFKLKNNRDLHDLYLKVDVMGLADVFEEFRTICLKDYELDPVGYLGLPGFGWDAMLKKTHVNLDLFSDPEMYQFCEAGKRGGISMAGHRYCKANNPDLLPEAPEEHRAVHEKNVKRTLDKSTAPKEYLHWCKANGYDAAKPTTWIYYIDANNLYGWAMCRKLPHKNFRWVETSEFDAFAAQDGDEACLVEVDLAYPDHLHNEHSNLPLAPELVTITEPMLSDYSLKTKRQMENKKADQELRKISSRKLVPHLGPRKHYIVHSANLKFYLQHGMVLEKVHRVLKFEQTAWLKPWIDFNTAKRAQAKNEFEKDFYKLMNNAVFGKTMEDVRGRTKCRFITTEEKYCKATGRPNYKYTMDFGTEDFRIVMEDSEKVELNKPIYTGITVLDTSKLRMYEFLYDVIQPLFGYQNVRLGKMDTDSFMLDITCEDLLGKLQEIQDELDTSDYPKEHPLYCTGNKKVVGKFKDETNGVPIWQRCILKAKCDSFICKEDSAKGYMACKKVCKGVPKAVIKKHIDFHDYLDALGGQVVRRATTTLRSIDHQIYTYKQNKIALTPYDDKRFIDDDGLASRPHGHYLNRQM